VDAVPVLGAPVISGDAVLELSDDVGEAAFEHAGYFLHRRQRFRAG